MPESKWAVPFASAAKEAESETISYKQLIVAACAAIYLWQFKHGLVGFRRFVDEKRAKLRGKNACVDKARLQL